MLSREQRGDLFTAIFAYSTGEELPEMDMVTQMCFGFIRSSLDSNSVKYQAKCEKNRENGARGGRPSSKPDGLENNRMVSDESDGISEEPNGKGGSDEKPNAKSENPINSDSNSNSNSESNSISDPEFNPDAAGAKERESFLKILLFDKKLLDPLPELERFIAHYGKTDWVDANGNAIKNREAALKGWRPDKDAVKCPAGIADIWREIYDGLVGTIPIDPSPMLIYFRGLYAEGDVLHITASSKELVDFLERPYCLPVVRDVLTRRFGPNKKINYRVLRS